MGALNVIDAAVDTGVQRLVLFSSSEVYQRAEQVLNHVETRIDLVDLQSQRCQLGLGQGL